MFIISVTIQDEKTITLKSSPINKTVYVEGTNLSINNESTDGEITSFFFSVLKLISPSKEKFDTSVYYELDDLVDSLFDSITDDEELSSVIQPYNHI